MAYQKQTWVGSTDPLEPSPGSTPISADRLNHLETQYEESTQYTDDRIAQVAPGDKGPVGDKGPDGDQGPVGDKGPDGDQGPVGDKGPDGDQGPVGDKGPDGDKGPSGDQGEWEIVTALPASPVAGRVYLIVPSE